MRPFAILAAVTCLVATGGAKAEPVSAASDSTLLSKLPDGSVKTVLERLSPQQRAAIEAASRYEIGLVESGRSPAPSSEDESRQIEQLVGARLALLVAANAFEDDEKGLAAWQVDDASELREAAMASEVRKTTTGRRFFSVEGLEAMNDLLSGSQLILKPLKPCNEGAIVDPFRINSCVYRQSYKSVVGIAWRKNSQLEISCTGQLISRRFVLTADHCFDDETPNPTILTHFTGGSARAVRKGRTEIISGLTEHSVAHVHRGTTSAAPNDLRGFDLALVELSSDVPFAGFPILGASIPDPPKMTAAGWGKTDAKPVNEIALEVTPISVRGSHNMRKIDPSLVAWPATLKDGGSICAGDSGGPIFSGPPGNDLSSTQLIGLVAAGNKNCTSGDQVITDLTRRETVEYMCKLASGNPYCRTK